MIINSLRYISNPNGIPRFESNAITVGTTNVSYTLTNAGTAFNNNFNGLILLKINQSIPSGTTESLPVVINSNIALITYNNTPITVSTFSGTGIYLVYYDSSAKSLQIIN